LEKVIPKGVKCPRCKGTGQEIMFSHMVCGGCGGKGVTQEELCPYCHHPVSSHAKFKYMGILWCGDESASGSFLCGCQASEKHAKPVCNVCGKDFGNCYCLESHLEKSLECRQKFKLTYYDPSFCPKCKSWELKLLSEDQEGNKIWECQNKHQFKW